MAIIPKHHIYQMWANDGTYLGVLQGVTTPFNLQQDINTIGPAAYVINVSQSADTAIIPVKAIITEDGKWLTTEDGRGLTTESEPSNYAVDYSKIKNGNRVRVTEVSDYHPTGKVVLDGIVKKWKVNFGTDDDSMMWIWPRSNDLSNYLMKAPDINYYSFTQQTSSYTIYGGSAGRRYVQGTSLIGFDLTDVLDVSYDNLSAVMYYMASESATPVDVTVRLFKLLLESEGSIPVATGLERSANPDFLVGEKTVTISNTSPAETLFTFDTPLPIEPGTLYSILVYASGSSGTGAKIYFTDTDPDGLVGQWSNLNDGVGWRTGLPPSYALTGGPYFRLYAVPPDTKTTITTFQPTDLVRTAMDNYIGAGGSVHYDANIVDTSTEVAEYTFSVNTVTEGLNILLSLSPSNYYYTVDPGSLELYFKPISDTADYTLLYRRDIQNLNLVASIENLENNIYMTGGKVGTVNVFVQRQNQESQQEFGVGISRINDPRVFVDSAANTVADNYLDRHDDEVYETTVTIPDTAMDITQFMPGQTIGFGGFGTLVDSLILPIVRVERSFDLVVLYLGVLPARQQTQINGIGSNVDALTTVDNPTTPS